VRWQTLHSKGLEGAWETCVSDRFPACRIDQYFAAATMLLRSTLEYTCHSLTSVWKLCEYAVYIVFVVQRIDSCRMLMSDKRLWIKQIGMLYQPLQDESDNAMHSDWKAWWHMHSTNKHSPSTALLLENPHGYKGLLNTSIHCVQASLILHAIMHQLCCGRPHRLWGL